MSAHPATPGLPSITGINHVTVAVSDLDRSLAFYVDLLGGRLDVRWATGAYLSLGSLWWCLSLDAPRPACDYTHLALDIDGDDLTPWRRHLESAGVRFWKDNRSEGESIYLLDPDGHRLELHAGSLDSRLASLRDRPYDGLRWPSEA